ncbi:Tubulin alpha-1C chain [Microtus ochrogaster]|uniref:Tubulin alpha-1C chain n=1 Tax=Microtus ochrogaster TaxID=79684 RepID=A0A8J6GCK4_MICOH|nr:Tubulin alpha-1C chain [Microtus ochrogaster]
MAKSVHFHLTPRSYAVTKKSALNGCGVVMAKDAAAAVMATFKAKHSIDAVDQGPIGFKVALPDHKFDTMRAKCAILHLYMDEDVEKEEFSETPEDYESRADAAEGDDYDDDCPRATTSLSQS